MGMLLDGIWRDQDPVAETGKVGNFQRVDSVFRDRITADGSSGFKAEAGRYHLYVAYGCPWAHRTLIFLALKKLRDAISVAYAIPGLPAQGWTYEDNPAFPTARRIASTASTIFTKPTRRAIRIIPARSRCRRCGTKRLGGS